MDDNLTLDELLVWLERSWRHGNYNGFTRHEIALYIIARFHNK